MSDDLQWTDRLRERGLRVTEPRVTVLSVVAEFRHESAETIAREARTRLGSLSIQAVYDNLSALVEAGLIRRIEPAGHPARYEARVGDNHHHVICRLCGTTEDVDCAIGPAPCLEPSESHGFLIDEAEVVYWGVCPKCQLRKREINE